MAAGLTGPRASWFRDDLRALVRVPRPPRGGVPAEPGPPWRRLLLAVALLGVLGIGLVVRLAYLHQPMRFDEALTVQAYARRPITDFISDYSLPNNHFLHTILVHVSMRLFGDAPWSVRLPVLIAGMLVIPAGYLLGREFHGATVGIILAGFLAANSTLVEYSTNARGHVLVALFSVLAMHEAHRLKRDAGRGWLTLILLNVLGFYTVPLMLYAFGTIGLWLFLSACVWDVPGIRRGAFIRRLVLAGLVTGLIAALLHLPAFLGSGPSLVLDNQYVRPRGFLTMVYRSPRAVRTLWGLWHRDVPSWVGLGMAAAAVLGLLARWFGRSRERIPILVALVVYAAIFTGLRRVLPQPRSWLFALPVYLMSAAAGTAMILDRRLRRPRAVVAASVVLAVAFAAFEGQRVIGSNQVGISQQTGRYLGAEALAQHLEAILEPGDVVVGGAPALAPTAYYARRRGMDPSIFIRARGPIPEGARRVYVLWFHGPTQWPLSGLLDQVGLSGELVLVYQHQDVELYRAVAPASSRPREIGGQHRAPGTGL